MPMEMPKPTPTHKKLERFAATWSGDETMHPSQWCPESFVGKAKLAGRAALDGFFTLGDYEQARDGKVTYRAHFVFGYDAAKDEVVLSWYDTMGAGGPETFRGKWQGDRMTLVAKSAMGMARISYDFSEKGTLRTKMEMSADGTKWNGMFDGVYHKTV